MFSERGFIRPDIEMLGRLIQERDSIVVENVAVGGLCSVLNRKSVGVPEDAVADMSLRFPAFCNALGEKYVLSVGVTVSTLLDTCVPESTCYKIVKPLVDDHPSFTTTPI